MRHRRDVVDGSGYVVGDRNVERPFSDGASWRTVNGRRLGSDARASHDHSVL